MPKLKKQRFKKLFDVKQLKIRVFVVNFLPRLHEFLFEKISGNFHKKVDLTGWKKLATTCPDFFGKYSNYTNLSI